MWKWFLHAPECQVNNYVLMDLAVNCYFLCMNLKYNTQLTTIILQAAIDLSGTNIKYYPFTFTRLVERLHEKDTKIADLRTNVLSLRKKVSFMGSTLVYK